MEQQSSTETTKKPRVSRPRSVTHDARAFYYPGFSIGNGVDVLPDGTISPRLDAKPMFVSYPLKEVTQYSIPMTLAGRHVDYTWPLGLSIISGPTGGGKSTLLRSLGNTEVLTAVEPFDDITAPEALRSFESVDEAFLYAISRTVSKRAAAPLFAIDSLRESLFETTGAAGAKGIVMPFFTKVTRVSNALAKMGMTVVATVNPMDDDPEFVKKFLGYLSASVPCFMHLQSTVEAGSGHRFTGTVTARGGDDHRRTLPFVIDNSGQTSGISVSQTEIIDISTPADVYVPKIMSAQSINALNQE